MDISNNLIRGILAVVWFGAGLLCLYSFVEMEGQALSAMHQTTAALYLLSGVVSMGTGTLCIAVMNKKRQPVGTALVNGRIVFWVFFGVVVLLAGMFLVVMHITA